MDIFAFYSLNILLKAFHSLLEILPYLVLGTAAGEALKYTKLQSHIEGFRYRNSVAMTVIASALGMISPLCTYGTVPVVMRLAGSGMPAAVLVIFLISSSMMNPQLFILTWGGIGWEMALMRAATIMVFSLLMGSLLRILPQEYIFKKDHIKEYSVKGNNNGCRGKVFSWKAYMLSILKSLEHTGFYLVIGVLLGAAIEVLMPGDIANRLYRMNKTLQIILMSLLSIPFYSCGGGVIPIVRALMLDGMSQGVLLAFLNVGAATRITVLAALLSIVRPIFVVIYILALMAFSILTGYLYI